MSQDFSLFLPDLLQTLQVDISKFTQHGHRVFRVNIPCKYKEQCKYGKYSCYYSHECFCKFQKRGKKCLNVHCMHNHKLSLEFLVAQALMETKTLVSSVQSSIEASKSPPKAIFTVFFVTERRIQHTRFTTLTQYTAQ